MFPGLGGDVVAILMAIGEHLLVRPASFILAMVLLPSGVNEIKFELIFDVVLLLASNEAVEM